MGIRRTAATAALVVVAGLSAGAAAPQAAPIPSAPTCTDLPGRERLEPGHLRAAGRVQLRNADPHDRARHRPAPGLRLLRGLRHPVQLVCRHAHEGEASASTTPRSRTGSRIRSRRTRRSRPASDHHMLIVDRGTCKLYEMWNVRHTKHGWRAGSGAIWDMKSNRAAARRLDERRRRRAADPARAGALRPRSRRA